MDDNSESFAGAVPLSGITSIAPGESVIFIETGNLASVAPAFLNTWFGANPPAGLQIGSYSGGGVGLSTGGDAVNLYNSAGVLQANVFFGASPAGPIVPDLRQRGRTEQCRHLAAERGRRQRRVRGGERRNRDRLAGNDRAARVVISEVSPWSSGNAPYAADWFEVTNTGAGTVDITGWKMDDNSNAFASAVALRGVTSIPAGKSAVFLEGACGRIHGRDVHRQLRDRVGRNRDAAQRLPRSGSTAAPASA